MSTSLILLLLIVVIRGFEVWVWIYVREPAFP